MKDTYQHQQKYLSFFSVGDPMKICKFVLKVEQALIKYYKLKAGSIIQSIYKDLQISKTETNQIE